MEYTDAQIAALGCIPCKRMGYYWAPAEIHHVRKLRTSKKRKNAPRIPMCYWHHRGGGYGVALHAGEKEFEKNYGTVDSMLDEVAEMLTRRHGS